VRVHSGLSCDQGCFYLYYINPCCDGHSWKRFPQQNLAAVLLRGAHLVVQCGLREDLAALAAGLRWGIAEVEL
jgi:hypothetical protein